MSKRFPENQAKITWQEGGVRFSLVWRDFMHGFYCGYCRLPKRITEETGYRGIITYVPAHGGITYAEESPDGSMVYGFDCNHYKDEGRPKLRDVEWLKAECERMAKGVVAVAAYEKRYLAAGADERSELLDTMHDKLREAGLDFDLSDNTGALIGALCGQL